MEKTAKKTNHWLIKMLAILAACVMLLVGVSLLYSLRTADAAEMAEQTITVSDVTVNRGMEFDVDISIGNNQQGIQAIRLFVTFDPTAMTLIGVTPKDPVENEDWTSEFDAAGKDADETYNSYGVKRFVLVWVNGGKWYGEGTIATLRFCSKSAAAAKDYQINVTVDPDNTLLSIGEKRDLTVTGGRVTMLPGIYSVYLYDAYGSEYAFRESNTDTADVTIAKALEMRDGLPPTKEATSRYIYTFRGWDEVESGDHAKYEPTYTATPVPYDITFKKGIQWETDGEITYTGEHTSENVVHTKYAKIINYDAEIPEKFDDFYTFLGWYKDEACTEPVDFVVMPDRNMTVYGYYKLNVDEPGVTTTELTVDTSFVREGDEDYVLATVSVTKNFGINSLRFVPVFDASKLEFVGFLYESDNAFYTTLGGVFPEINDAIKADANVVDAWQLLAANETLEGKAFLFLNENDNAYATGKLITLKYKVKPTTASDSALSVAIAERGVTRYDQKGYCHYANATVVSSQVNVVRVVKPTAYTDLEKTYTYDPTGNKVVYTFKTKGGEGYYDLTGHEQDAVGSYTATATLTEIADTLVTWADGSVAPLTFDYEILPFVVTRPVPTDDTYVYSGSEKYFAFTAESTLHSDYYTVENDKKTAAGSYTVTVTLKDTDNLLWDNETTAPLEYDFTIERIKVVKPTAYTALEKTYTFDPGNMAPAAYNNDGVNITYEFKSEDNASKAYYDVSNNVKKVVGDYTVTVSLLDQDNTEWADEDQTVDTDDLTFDFIIGKYLIATPTVASKAFNGSLQTATVTLPTNAPFSVTENAGGVDLGDYDVVFTIGDDFYANYAWADSSTKSVTATFHIAESANEWTVLPFVNGKTYDGTTATYGASAKYGTVEVLYRLQSGTDDDYTATAPVDAGAYLAKFTVAGTESYDPIVEVVPFVISKVRLNKPVAYTAEEKSYTYTGESVSYVFKQSGNAEAYDVSGNVETNAGNYTVTVAIKDEYKANYIWKGETVEEDSAEDLTYDFVIAKAQLTVPVAAEKSYVYNGEEQTFEFTAVEYSDRYSIYGNKHTDAGKYTITARIENANKVNYEWADGTTSDKLYSFEIRYASLSASTTTGDNDYTVTLSTVGGFAADSEFGLIKAAPDVSDILAKIAAGVKHGALGQLSDDAAALLVQGKCFVASLVLNIDPALAVGEYATTILLPAERSKVVVLRLIGEEVVEVFALQQSGKSVSFTADGVSNYAGGAYNYVILADHDYVERPLPVYLVSEADCEHPAVYYKSCACGVMTEETFEYGDPLGHDYDFDHITWTWSADHLAATARVACRNDASHVLFFSADEVTVETVGEPISPAVDRNGRIERRASITYKGDTYYSDIDVEIIPAGHVFSSDPIWDKKIPKATFICDCGEVVVTPDVTISLSDPSSLTYTAKVEFRGKTYEHEYDRPYVLFDFADGTNEASVLMLPGEKVKFIDETGHARSGYIFVGWRDEAGTLIVGDYDGYQIGYKPLSFTAEWKRLTDITITVTDTDGTSLEGATVSLYENDDPKYEEGVGGANILVPNYTFDTTASGEVTFPSIPYGNYRLVVTYPYTDGVDIVRSTYIDVVEPAGHEGEGLSLTVVLPKTKFNTIVEGIGSAEGLEGAISEKEKNEIADGTAADTVNEIIITQKRNVISDVDDEKRGQIIAEMRQDSEYATATLVDFYDITLWKATIIRNASGEQYTVNEQITTAVSYQTNIFPISTALREQILAVNGTEDNIFVYKRHEYPGGVVVIYPLPKYDEAEGANAETECFYIKEVAGQKYIAIRQKEYSVLAFGVSSEPVLIMNKITSLTISDRVYGDTQPFDPVAHALYMENTVVFTYATEEDGDFSSVKPVNAGVYYLRAFIDAKDGYAAAEKIIRFEIKKKEIARPAADTTEFTYNGTAQTYTIAPSSAYTVENNVQTNAGKYDVIVSLTDPDNTVWDSGLDGDLSYDFVIGKKKLTDIGDITFEDKSFWFNGKKHSITISGELPEGVEVSYIGNDESDLGKFTVTAVFVSSNPNYDVSDPMTAVMNIRLNWIPILILIVIALAIIITAIVIVERMMKKEKEGQTPSGGGGGGDPQTPSNAAESAGEEGSNND